MDTDEDELQSDEKRKALPGILENLRSCYSPARNKPIPRVLLKFAFFFLSLLFAAAFVGVLTKHDFLPYFTEHARELSKHRAREEEVEFHFVDNIENFPHKDERLPVDLEPLSYKLDLRVNLTRLRYSGVVKIKFLCKNATRFVILHSGDLDILNVSMTGRGKAREKGLRVQRIVAFKKNQQLCIELRKVLRKGEVYFVTLEFKSKISNTLEGFYKSSYSTKSGEKRYMANSLNGNSSLKITRLVPLAVGKLKSEKEYPNFVLQDIQYKKQTPQDKTADPSPVVFERRARHGSARCDHPLLSHLALPCCARRASRVAQHEHDWGRVRQNSPLALMPTFTILIHILKK